MAEYENITGTVIDVATIEPINSTMSSTMLDVTSHTLVDIQWGNLVLSSVAGIIIHVYIAFSVLKQKMLTDNYMVLTYMRSYIDVFYIGATLFIQELFVLQEGKGYPSTVYSQFFANSNADVQKLSMDIKRLAQQLQMLMLIMMIVHRFLIFTRPGVITLAYGIFTIFVLVFCSIMGIVYTPSRKGYDAIYMITVSLMVVLAAVVHSALKKYFTAHKYSTNVCEMQGKTSKFLLYIILIYSVSYVVFPLISIFCSGIIAALVTSDPRGKTLSASAISYIIGKSLVPWLPLADGILTLWSVKGYLAESENNERVTVVQSSAIQNNNESEC